MLFISNSDHFLIFIYKHVANLMASTGPFLYLVLLCFNYQAERCWGEGRRAKWINSFYYFFFSLFAVVYFSMLEKWLSFVALHSIDFEGIIIHSLTLAFYLTTTSCRSSFPSLRLRREEWERKRSENFNI